MFDSSSYLPLKPFNLRVSHDTGEGGLKSSLPLLPCTAPTLSSRSSARPLAAATSSAKSNNKWELHFQSKVMTTMLKIITSSRNEIVKLQTLSSEIPRDQRLDPNKPLLRQLQASCKRLVTVKHSDKDSQWLVSLASASSLSSSGTIPSAIAVSKIHPCNLLLSLVTSLIEAPGSLVDLSQVGAALSKNPHKALIMGDHGSVKKLMACLP